MENKSPLYFSALGWPVVLLQTLGLLEKITTSISSEDLRSGKDQLKSELKSELHTDSESWIQKSCKVVFLWSMTVLLLSGSGKGCSDNAALFCGTERGRSPTTGVQQLCIDHMDIVKRNSQHWKTEKQKSSCKRIF